MKEEMKEIEKYFLRVRGNKIKDSPKIFKKAYEFIEPEIARYFEYYPYFREIESAQDSVVEVGNKKIYMFGSNSYLGLTNHPKIKEAAKKAIEKYGTGCVGSRFLNGNLKIHRELEEKLAEFVGKEEALVFSTGFLANSGVISSLVKRGEYLILDKKDHASIYEGSRVVKANGGEVIRFEHNSPSSLEEIIKNIMKKDEDSSALVVIEGVYSMEGDIANLPKILEVCKKYKVGLMLDDAHGIGVLGKEGKGTADYFNLTNEVDIIMGTFSKSFASQGGFVASSHEIIDYLKHLSTSSIFTAALSPSNTATVIAALDLIKEEPYRIEMLWENTKRMKEGLKNLHLDTGKSETPIIPLYVKDMKKTFLLCKKLFEENIFVNPVISPAVRIGEEMIRISMMATHTKEQIDFVLEKIDKISKELDVPRLK
ncbi:MAG: aminotransferase class I/II-fold pyridoxal phosphate-dependent enzyme [Candidatus Pacearchaeota archaeon]